MYWYLLFLKISAWEESDKLVKIYLTGLDGAKEIDASNISFNATPISINFKINNLNGKNWSFEIKELCSTIDHEKSYYKAKSGMYECNDIPNYNFLYKLLSMTICIKIYFGSQ